MTQRADIGAIPVPDGLVVVVKDDCPTCHLVLPALGQILDGPGLTVITQDSDSWPAGFAAIHDDTLELSWHLQTDTTPTLYRIDGGNVSAFAVGWHRERWEEVSGVTGLAPDLPEQRPGCGSKIFEPGTHEQLVRRHSKSRLASRTIELGSAEDEFEAMYARGWSDGLPLIPPTPQRVEAMLAGTARPPGEVVAVMPPDLVDCTVEKVAINAVMAGCRPEYLPVVLAAVEAAATDRFNIHGVAATTFHVGPVVVVNGPIRNRIGMNGGMNALGPGNRANATIGRALNLVVRNVGGSRPGGVDRATLGSPAKLSFCFPELEEGSPWESLAIERGFGPEQDTVTLFAGHGPHEVVDQLSREPASLARSFAVQLRTVWSPKLALRNDALVVVAPDHARTFAAAGWTKARLRDEIQEMLTVPGEELLRGMGGIAEGMPDSFIDRSVPKFRDGGLWFVHAGGAAGMFSGIIGGWSSGPGGSEMTTVPIIP
ncbi:MAG: thioredoxin [Acidimicrobiia bacterium]